MDYATHGNDAQNGTVYLTAYHDRLNDAESLADILPAYMNFHMGQSTQRWFRPDHCDVIQDVTFTMDPENDDLWTGTWTTSDDENLHDINEEDLGRGVSFEGMQLVQNEVSRPILTHADDASNLTFNTTFGNTSIASDTSGDNPQQAGDPSSPASVTNDAGATPGGTGAP